MLSLAAIFSAISATRPRADVAYCIHALARRLSKTHNWAVCVLCITSLLNMVYLLHVLCSSYLFYMDMKFFSVLFTCGLGMWDMNLLWIYYLFAYVLCCKVDETLQLQITFMNYYVSLTSGDCGMTVTLWPNIWIAMLTKVHQECFNDYQNYYKNRDYFI